MTSIKLLTITAATVGSILLLVAFNTLRNSANQNIMINPIKQNTMNLQIQENGFAVVELFTSEGCSSCPPADKLIETVQQEQPNKPLYILAYHVDYWDHQGWKDIYSNAAYSKRQERYGNWLRLSTIYTPQIVVNGKDEFVGSNRQALADAIAEGLQEIPLLDLKIASHVVNNQINIDYQTNRTDEESELVLALIQKKGQNRVQAGENTGRHLSHVQIVRDLNMQPLRNESGKVLLVLPKDYTKQEWEVIGFVQNKSNGKIVSAAKSALSLNKATN